MEHGIIIRGTLLGYKSNEFVNRETGEARKRHVLGIGISKISEFGSKVETVQKISISDDNFTNELINKLNSLKTKDVEIHVDFSAWEFNGKVGNSVTYLPEYGISEVK